MASFHDIQFPADISWGCTGGPGFSTTVMATASGYEQRNINWSGQRCAYVVGHAVKSDSSWQTLLQFFYARMGKAYGFRFKDWSDYQATAQNIGTGDGVKTTFQMVKTYSDSQNTYNRTITRPCSGTVADATGYTPIVPNIYDNGTKLTTGYSINFTTGVVTFTTAPVAGHIITADFEFDVPVRFDIDKIDAVLSAYQLHDWLNIPLIELRGN